MLSATYPELVFVPGMARRLATADGSMGVLDWRSLVHPILRLPVAAGVNEPVTPNMRFCPRSGAAPVNTPCPPRMSSCWRSPFGPPRVERRRLYVADTLNDQFSAIL